MDCAMPNQIVRLLPFSVSLLFLVLVALPIGQSCQAQLKVEIDEEVKVPYLGKWYTGVVVDKKKREILVEFEWVGAKQEVFTRRQIRKLYEYEGLDFGRIWVSANEKFKIEASLLRFDGDKVVLIKPDLDEISVPIAKLGTKEQAYIKKFKKSRDAAVRAGTVPAVTPVLPEIEDMGNSGLSFSTFTSKESKLAGPLGALPGYFKNFKQAGFGFNKIREDQKLIAVIPVGGPEQLVLMSFRERNPFGHGEKFQSQLYWISLKNSKVVNFVSITHEDYAIDYDPKTKLLLTFNRSEEFIGEVDQPDNYTVWEMAPGGSEATPTMRFAAKGLGWSKSLFGKIIDSKTVIIQTEKETFKGYDLESKKVRYVVKQKSFFGAPTVLSRDRKHLILPEDGQVSLVDTSTGDFVLTHKVADRHVSGANVNDAGTKLAGITERNIYVWDLASGSEEPEVYPAPLIGSPFKSRIEWVGDDYILGESHTSRILYRLSLKLPVWSYEMDVRQYFLNRDPLKNMVVNGHFFYVAQPDVWGKTIAVGAVSLPGPSVEETTQNINRDDLLLVKRGVGMAIELHDVKNAGQVEDWLIDKIEANDWVYDPDAELVMHAEMGIGSTQTIEYQEIGSRKTSTVSYRPHYANLKIKKDKLIVWQTGTSTGAPGFVQGDPQAEVNKYQTARLQFFKNVKIAVDIMDPKYSRGFGKSKLGLRGIEVVSMSPPGREDDPEAAANKADDDQRKAAEEEGKDKKEDKEDSDRETRGRR